MSFINKSSKELRKQDLQFLSFSAYDRRSTIHVWYMSFSIYYKNGFGYTYAKSTFEDISCMCKCCNVMFKTWLKFQEHNSTIHRNLIFCPYCYKSHVNYEELKSHWSLHEPYECKLCYKTFISWRHFNDHKISTHCGQECDHYVAIMLLEE
ncbi:zinc finger protein 18-like [Pogonomyrmex barbatus]|uniref:Zinc finger protein 18-like n=1 Tax=Pogonomyrmex barbatus TaxID=144034 RepID=A0A6I9W4I3_9HYME|nr:zinc finger protein 18-like [Pogonomyrmex barbatus]